MLCSIPKQVATSPNLGLPVYARQRAGTGAPKGEATEEEEEKDKRTLHFQASGGLRYPAGLRKVFPSLPIRKGIFIIIKMMIFFKRGKQDRLARPSGIGNSQGKEGEKQLTPQEARASTSLVGTTKGLRD